MVGEAVSACLAARGGARSDVVVKLLEDEVKDKSGEDTAKGTPLSKAFELLEKDHREAGVRNQQVFALSYSKSKRGRRQRKTAWLARMWQTDSREMALNMLMMSRGNMAWDGRRLA